MRIELLLFLLGYRFMVTGKHLRRGKARQATVVVLAVVPVHIVPEPLLGMSRAAEAARVVWLVFAGFELAFAERIVVTNPRATDPEVGPTTSARRTRCCDSGPARHRP